MELESFTTLDALFAEATRRREAANSQLHDKQRSITYGSDVVSIEPGGLIVFGHILSKAEIVADTKDDEPEEARFAIQQTEANHDHGILYGTFASCREPDGEFRSTHRVTLWPIDHASYEWAREFYWDLNQFPVDLANNIGDRLAELVEHVASTGGAG